MIHVHIVALMVIISYLLFSYATDSQFDHWNASILHIHLVTCMTDYNYTG
jgi:hypothetical protein